MKYTKEEKIMQEMAYFDDSFLKGKKREKSNLHRKGSYKQDEKTALRMGENNCKWNNWQRINVQNILAAHEAQYQKNNPIQKNGQKT